MAGPHPTQPCVGDHEGSCRSAAPAGRRGEAARGGRRSQRPCCCCGGGRHREQERRRGARQEEECGDSEGPGGRVRPRLQGPGRRQHWARRYSPGAGGAGGVQGRARGPHGAPALRSLWQTPPCLTPADTSQRRTESGGFSQAGVRDSVTAPDRRPRSEALGQVQRGGVTEVAQEPCGHQGRDEDTSAQPASAPEHAGGFLCCPPLPLSSPRSPPPLSWVSVLSCPLPD